MVVPVITLKPNPRIAKCRHTPKNGYIKDFFGAFLRLGRVLLVTLVFAATGSELGFLLLVLVGRFTATIFPQSHTLKRILTKFGENSNKIKLINYNLH